MCRHILGDGTVDYGLGIKCRLRCKTRTKHYELNIKHRVCTLNGAYQLQSVFYTDQS